MKDTKAWEFGCWCVGNRSVGFVRGGARGVATVGFVPWRVIPEWKLSNGGAEDIVIGATVGFRGMTPVIVNGVGIRGVRFVRVVGNGAAVELVQIGMMNGNRRVVGAELPGSVVFGWSLVGRGGDVRGELARGFITVGSDLVTVDRSTGFVADPCLHGPFLLLVVGKHRVNSMKTKKVSDSRKE
jgi:hypothetical protein